MLLTTANVPWAANQNFSLDLEAIRKKQIKNSNIAMFDLEKFALTDHLNGNDYKINHWTGY